MARTRSSARIRRAGMQPVQWLAGLTGLALLVLGIVGFTRTGVSDWTSSNVATVIGFHLTAGRSLIYVIAGAFGLLMALLAGTARLYGWLLLIGSAALTLWGLAVVGTFSSNPVSGMGNPLALGISDNWWHAGGMLLGLIVAVLPARRVIVTDEPQVEEPVNEPAQGGGLFHRQHDDVGMRDVNRRDDVARHDDAVRDDNRVVRDEHNKEARDPAMATTADADEAPARRSRWRNLTHRNNNDPATH
jgi:hypothetical protein